jgi:hypothetical protein
MEPEEAFDQWIAGLGDEDVDSESFAEDAFHAGWNYGYEQGSADSCGCI